MIELRQFLPEADDTPFAGGLVLIDVLPQTLSVELDDGVRADSQLGNAAADDGQGREFLHGRPRLDRYRVPDPARGVATGGG